MVSERFVRVEVIYVVIENVVMSPVVSCIIEITQILSLQDDDIRSSLVLDWM